MAFIWQKGLCFAQRSPEGELKDAIDRDFGSLEEFKKQFKAAGATQFWQRLGLAHKGQGRQAEGEALAPH